MAEVGILTRIAVMLFRSVLLALTLLWFTSPLFAGKVTEDFLGFTKDTPASHAGWFQLFGPGTIDDWVIGLPSQPLGHDGPALVAKTAGKNNQIYKNFKGKTGITESTSDIEYTVVFTPTPSGEMIQNIRFGAVSNTQKPTVLFGIPDSQPHASNFAFQVGQTVSSQLFPGMRWYEAKLKIDVSGGAESATGSLFVKNLTDGDTKFNPVLDLQNIPLNLDADTRPAQWTSWLIRSQFRQQVGGLSLETEH